MNSVDLREEWRDIEGYEGYYQVSNKGRVKSLCRPRHKTPRGKGGMLRERVLKNSVNGDGYKNVILTKKGKRQSIKVHRLVATHFISNNENKPEVNHKDGNKLNNKISNLEWATSQENVIHSFEMGLNPTKIDICKEKLETLVREGLYVEDLAEVFDCSVRTIRTRAREYKIELNSRSRKKYDIDEDRLIEELKIKTQTEIAKEIGCSISLISLYVKDINKRRDI